MYYHLYCSLDVGDLRSVIQAVIDYQPVRNKIKYLVHFPFTGSKNGNVFRAIDIPNLARVGGGGEGGSKLGLKLPWNILVKLF